MSDSIQIVEPSGEEKFSIFSYGFRPFFLAAGVYAILPLFPWMLYLCGWFSPEIPLQSWHAHEMLFGFVAAGISGFLLTAIPNWTNTLPLTGAGLKRFFYFWLSGRIAFWLFLIFPHPVFGALLFLDLLLPVAQTIRIARIFTKTGSRRNFIFIGIMAALSVANLLVILDLNGITGGTANIAAIFAPNIIMLTLAVIGGRVTPNFTRSYLRQRGESAQVRSFLSLDVLAIALLVANAAVDLIVPHSLYSVVIALSAAAIHLLRFSFWQTARVLGNPALWVLHLGYIWLITALILKGAEHFVDLPYNLYLHAFTVGAVGTYLLGIMTRAALGHTGRKLEIRPMIAGAYLLISAATLLRLVVPFHGEVFVVGMTLTSLLWIMAFMLYLWVYVPMLTRPRIDGKPG